jgi:hypothetical protein
MDMIRPGNFLESKRICLPLDMSNQLKVKSMKLEASEHLIGKYVNQVLWSDVNPIGKIVAIKSKTKLVLARVEAIANVTKMQFEPGGFSAHCSNNNAQKWLYAVDENDLFEVSYSWTNFKKSFYRVENAPYKFYDFNF